MMDNKPPDPDTLELLLVDDQDPFRQALARRLARRGFSPRQFSSGESCLEYLETHPCDLVILDVKMPGMGGLEVLKAIKQSPAPPQVILLTGNAAVEDGVEGIRAGAFDYLTKPVEIDHLVNKIHQALDMVAMEKSMIHHERLVALGTLSTGIAHEINNPLAVISEATQIIRQLASACPPEQKDLLNRAISKIETSIKRSRTITHQLLGYARHHSPSRETIDLKQLFSETATLLKKELGDRGIQLEYPSSPLPGLVGDVHILRQILINLVTNALQAQVHGGKILITVEENPLCIQVKDQGPGIAPEHMEKIFDPFFSTKPFNQGTGLGLFVVHKLATQLGAKIQVQSRRKKGTSFILIFPKTTANLNPAPKGDTHD